jgi:RND family efflux transporter MFP subunit
MKWKRNFLIALIVFGSIVLVWAGYWEKPIEVETVKVERGDLDVVIRVTGEVINDRSVELTALVDGQVVGIEAGVGDRVKAGQVLAHMDNRAAAAKHQRAQAFLQQHAVLRKEAELSYQRLKKLAVKSAVTQQQLQQAELNWEAATAAWQVAKAELRLTQVAQEWQQVTAPFDAVVVKKSTEVGQWVEAGTKLFTLVALDQREIEAHVDAVDSGQIRVGQPVEIRCDAFPGQSWLSRITWIGPNVEQEKDHHLNTFRVRMGLGASPPPLLLGQQLDLEIRVARREKVLILPFSALKELGENYEVGLIESGILKYRPVEVGLQSDTQVELLTGVDEGSAVVRLESARLDPGIAIRKRHTP